MLERHYIFSLIIAHVFICVGGYWFWIALEKNQLATLLGSVFIGGWGFWVVYKISSDYVEGKEK